MHREYQGTVRPTDSVFVLMIPAVLGNQPWISDDPYDSSAWDMSHAASPDIAELQKEHEIIGQKLQSRWAIVDQRLLGLRDLLYASFEAEPLEDGIDHPAENIIGDAIRSTGSGRVFDWLYRACFDSEYPTFSASVLRCLGRQMSPGTKSWRAKLVQKALTMDDVEIRDAALQAAELWGGLGMRDILQIRLQTEPLQWLRDYMQDVIEDLG
jgi:hypothetical protein